MLLISNVWYKMESSTTEKHITNLIIAEGQKYVPKSTLRCLIFAQSNIVCNLKCIVTSSETKLIEDVSNMY